MVYMRGSKSRRFPLSVGIKDFYEGFVNFLEYLFSFYSKAPTKS